VAHNCSIYAVNKIDQITIEELNVLDKLPHYCPVCAYHEWNLTGLVEMIFDYLKLIRIYTKPKGAPRTMLQLLVCFCRGFAAASLTLRHTTLV
jgi:ribosome-interacting GTPase 1